MSTFTSPFTGTVVTPTDLSYNAISFSSNTALYWPTVVNPTQVVAARIMDCVASAGGLSIALPDASQGTLGSDILFRNLGAHAFTITDAVGGQSFSVPVGISKYVYLVDNTSVAGSWNNVTFAAGTSAADAATLAGLGLTTVNGQLATTQNTVDFTSSNPTVNDLSRASTFVWNGGNGTFTLPKTQSLSTGWYVAFRNNGTGNLTLTPQSPDTLNGQTTVLTYPQDSGFIIYDANVGGFITIGYQSPSSVSFTSATYDVDAIAGNTFNLVSFAPIIQTYIAQSGTRTQTLAVTLPAITQIYILVNNTNQTGYNITFQNQGSSQPPYVLSAGNIVTMLSDGTNLFPLTTSAAGLFYAANGTAALPSYSFNNDTHTGMYLQGTGILGLSANSTELISIDNSNTLQPLVTVNAAEKVNGTLTATLIAGGTF